MPDAGAGHARPSPSPPERPEPRRLSPPGALRRAAAAVLVLLAGALLGGLAPETARAQTAQTVTLDWPLIPSGVGAGSSFRLLFVTTSDLLGSHTTVGPYNAIAQGDANAAGVDATIRGMQAEFRALVSTGTVDARDNTATTHTNTNRGVPIYWLGGAKVADDYADFYDGGWDSNVPRTRTGGTISGTPRTWTGSNSDGTRYASQAMGATQARVSFPKTQGSEISGGNASSSITRFPVYALSPVITVSLRPGQVKGVMVDQDTHNSVRVRWTKPAEASAAPVTRFTIWTRTRNAADNGWIVDLPTTDANGWIRRADVSGGSTTSRVLTGLPSGVRQEVRISARADRAGQTPPTLYGDNSAPVSFTTAAANAPGAPAAPTVSATADTHTSLDVSWSAPTNTGPAITGYDLQYRAGTSGDFAAGPQDVTGTSATIGSLEEGTSYQVQVRATNAVGHSGWSASGTGTTTAQLNSAPEFASDTATRSLPENTAAGTDIGAPLTATDADAGDTLTYSLSGSDAASFYIVAASGQLRTWSGVTYDFESRSSYTVTVEVSDSTATDTIAVTIALTDADEPPARPVPTFGTTTATSLVVNWQEPANSGPDIDDYDVQYRLASTAPSGAWTAHTHVGTATTTTIGSLQAGQSYQVQVRAANDEGTGDWSEPGTATAAANSAPAFVLGSYGFTLTENADGTTTAVDVGTVSATDADSGDTVSYSIAAGNTGGVFAIASNGAITYTGSGENFEGFADPANAFTLTVRASDDHNASADVAVTVAVTDVEGEAPAAPAAPTFGRTTSTSLAVNWLEPANTGPAITDYDVWYREEGTSGSFIGHWS